MTSLIRGLFIINDVLSRIVLFVACQSSELEDVPVVEVASAILFENRQLKLAECFRTLCYGMQITLMSDVAEN